jgi:hypothetical protein
MTNHSNCPQVATPEDDSAETGTPDPRHAVHPPAHMRRRAYARFWIAPQLAGGGASWADGTTEE